MKLISVQSRGNRLAIIESQKYSSQITGEVKTRYYLKRKQLMWKNGFFGPHLGPYSETTRKIAFNLAAEWLQGATT